MLFLLQKRWIIAIGIILGILVISLPLAILASGFLVTRVAEAPGVGLERLGRAALGIFQNKVQIDIASQTIAVTPISEIALAQQTIASTVVFKRNWFGSECILVAQQEYTVKYGYDTKTVFSIIRGGGAITVPPPKILSVEPKTGAPKILYQSNGWYNNAKVEDLKELTDRLHAQVRSDGRVAEFQTLLTGIVTQQLTALQSEIDRTDKGKDSKSR